MRNILKFGNFSNLVMLRDSAVVIILAKVCHKFGNKEIIRYLVPQFMRHFFYAFYFFFFVKLFEIN